MRKTDWGRAQAETEADAVAVFMRQWHGDVMILVLNL